MNNKKQTEIDFDKILLAISKISDESLRDEILADMRESGGAITAEIAQKIDQALDIEISVQEKKISEIDQKITEIKS